MLRCLIGLIVFAVPSAMAQSAGAPAPVTQPALDEAGSLRLIPSDALMYFEISRLDQQFDAFLSLLQQAGIPDPLQFVQQLVAARTSTTAPALPGAAILLNPGLIGELRKTGGASLAILGLAGPGADQLPFLFALRFGQSDTLRGYVRLMLAGLAQTVEPRAGWTLHALPGGIEVGLFEQAAIMGWPAGQVARAIERARGSGPSILDTPGFLEHVERFRQQGGLLGCIRWPQLAEAIRRDADALKRENFARVETVLSLDDLQTFWMHFVLGAETLDARVRIEWQTGTGPAYRLIRSRPLDRTILECVPADSMACLALSMDEGEARYEALMEIISTAHAHPPDGPGREPAREQLAAFETAIGLSLRDLLHAVDTMAVVVLPPDVATIARRQAAASTQPGGAAMPTWRQILRASALTVVSVRDAAVFDRTLERIAMLMPPGGSTPTAAALVIDRTTADGIERRTYRTGDETRLHVLRQDRLYILAGRPEVADAAMAAREGRVPHVLDGRNTHEVVASVPADASKVFLLRMDHLVNLITAVRTLQWGVRPGQVLYAPAPSMKPAVAWTVEETRQLELAATLNDLPLLARHLLQIVPRPPRMAPRRAPVTQPP